MGRTNGPLRAGTLVLAALAAACSSIEVSTPDVEFEVIEEVTFDPSLEIDLEQMTKLPSGVYIQDLVEGEGDALANGSWANVNYSGWLRTGFLFGTGMYQYLVGANQTIPGFEQGMLGMKAGGVRKIIVPPELGYGAVVFDVIPPGSVLVFEVELTEIN